MNLKKQLEDLGKIFTNYTLFEIFILSVFSGIPWSILYTIISAWLYDSGVRLEIITTIVIAGLPYSLKFLWAPLVDYFKIPLLHRLGHRKSWLILCSIIIVGIIYAMSKISPKESLMQLYALSMALGTVAATFDISMDAFRIERVEHSMLANAAANSVVGYRIGVLLPSAGALYIAHITNNWPQTFVIIAAAFALSIAFILTINEKSYKKLHPYAAQDQSMKGLFNLTFRSFSDFLYRDGAALTLVAIVLFKLGDSFLYSVSTPFYMELGFNKAEIATATKLYSIIASIIGSYFGGFLMYRFMDVRGMIIAGLAQSLTNVFFIWLNHQGNDFNALLLVITAENFASGMGTAAMVAYLSILCNKRYSATQYAFLISAATIIKNSLTIYSGTLVRALGWDWFFLLTVFLGLPSILILWHLYRKQRA